MSNPGAFGDPDHYDTRYLGPDDNGGVHHNSGIANQAYYLAIEGGTNRTSGLHVTGVGSSNREQIEQVFYRAFTMLLPSNATFSVARAACEQAARDLYGSSSAVVPGRVAGLGGRRSALMRTRFLLALTMAALAAPAARAQPPPALPRAVHLGERRRAEPVAHVHRHVHVRPLRGDGPGRGGLRREGQGVLRRRADGAALAVARRGASPSRASPTRARPPCRAPFRTRSSSTATARSRARRPASRTTRRPCTRRSSRSCPPAGACCSRSRRAPRS